MKFFCFIMLSVISNLVVFYDDGSSSFDVAPTVFPEVPPDDGLLVQEGCFFGYYGLCKDFFGESTAPCGTTCVFNLLPQGVEPYCASNVNWEIDIPEPNKFIQSSFATTAQGPIGTHTERTRTGVVVCGTATQCKCSNVENPLVWKCVKGESGDLSRVIWEPYPEDEPPFPCEYEQPGNPSDF